MPVASIQAAVKAASLTAIGARLIQTAFKLQRPSRPRKRVVFQVANS